jgi:hypothetical protein
MDLDQFFDLADYYADQGSFARDSIKSIVDGDLDQPQRNIDSTRKFLKRLAAAGVDTWGVEETL